MLQLRNVDATRERCLGWTRRGRAALSGQWFPRFLLAVLLLWEAIILFVAARNKLLWYDELLTCYVSGLHPLRAATDALKAGADGMPLGYYLIVRTIRLLPGDVHQILRAPSILGYVLALGGVYMFSRRRIGRLESFLPLILIAVSPFRTYALEARSYTLLVGLLALSAALWQRVDDKRLMPLLLSLSLAAAVSTHHMAVVALLVFGIAEISWTVLSGRVRWHVWAAITFASSPFLLGLPTLLQLKEVYGDHFWSKPYWTTVLSTYQGYLRWDTQSVLMVLTFFGLAVRHRITDPSEKVKSQSQPEGFRIPEVVLVCGFLFYPALLVIITKVAGSGYTFRYGWPGIIGFALILPAVLRRDSWCFRPILTAVVLTMVFQSFTDFRSLTRAKAGGEEERWKNVGELSNRHPNLPVVIADDLKYLEGFHYASADVRYRLVELSDSAEAIAVIGSDSANVTNTRLARFVPLRIHPLKSFLANNPRFLVCAGGSDWVTPYLLRSGYRLTLLSKTGDCIYLVEN